MCLILPTELGGTEYPDAGDTRDLGSISGSGRSPGERNGNPLQYSCLGNPTRGAWWATVHGVVTSQTWLSTHTHTHTQQQQQHAEHLSWSSGFPLLHTYITRAVSLVPTLSWFFLRSIECQCTGKILLEDTSSPPVPSCLWLPVLCSLPLAHTWQFHENSGWHLACWYGNPIFLLCSARSESVLVPSFWGGSCLYVHFRLGGSPALSVLWWAQTRPDLVDYPSWPCGYPSFPCWGESDTVFSFLHLNTWVV